MTIFRGELGGWFLVMFISLLVGKVWGWIGEGRVEYLEQQPPANPHMFHTRLTASLVLSVLFNSFMLRYCIYTVLEQARPDMMVMFGFEFAVLSILSCSTAARYAISLVEIYVTQQQTKAKVEERRAEIRSAREDAIQQRAQSGETEPPTNLPDENDINEMELDIPGWEEKGRWIFYLDLITDFCKLVVYLTFFSILFTFYGLPIHILRDVVLTIRSFARRIMDFVRYRNATRDMNERYPDATAEEVAREDVCIICREEMAPWQPPADQAVPGRPAGAPRIPERLRPKKLPCGHILHFTCLRSWLERQQNCPTCRRPVIMPRHHGPADGGNGGAGPQQNAPGGNQPIGPNVGQADGVPRARIYQFGPFRIGFGAGRGDLFRNLHQQIHGNAPQQAPNMNPPGARQIGFGFGFGRPPAAPAAPAPAPVAPTPVPAQTTQPTPSVPSTSANIQSQLQQLEQQILQELENLRVSVHQLQGVRLLQAELQRLRNLQNTTLESQGTPVQNPPQPPSSSAAPSMPLRREFVTREPPMPSGDTRLPEGFSLPTGWSLMPLHTPEQLVNGQANAPAAASTAPEAPAPPPAPENPTVPQPPPTENVEGHSRNDEIAEAPSSAPAQDLPDWQPESATEPASHPVESPTHNWTDVTSEKPTEKVEGPSATPGDEEQPHEAEPDETSSTSSKGKGRAVTVEDAVDDET